MEDEDDTEYEIIDTDAFIEALKKYLPEPHCSICDKPAKNLLLKIDFFHIYPNN